MGLLVGTEALDLIQSSPSGEAVKLLAEATLTVVLFADASRIDMRKLRQEYAVPARLLGFGLPLTIAFGALLAAALFGALSIPEAFVLAVLLAPTDAALGQAVVTEPTLPTRIRQGLNVESGLNDGICVPLLFIVLAVAEADAGQVGAAHAIRIVVEEIGYGVAGGVVAGIAAAAAITFGSRRRLIEGIWLQIIPVAAAGLAYGIAAPLGGSGFIAAFAAGMTFGVLRLPSDGGEVTFFTDELGELLNGVTLLVFGAVLLGSALDRPQLAHRPLRSRKPDGRPHAAGRRRDAGRGRAAPNRRVPRLVRPTRAGVDRVRRDRRAGSRPTAVTHDPAHDVRHRRSLRPRPRGDGSPARTPLRRMVRLTPTRHDAANGKRAAAAHRWRRPAASVDPASQ